MSQPHTASEPGLTERLRARLGRRAAGIVLTVLLEGLLVLLLLTFGTNITRPGADETATTVLNLEAPAAPEPAPAEADAPDPEAAEDAPIPPQAAPPEPRPPEPNETLRKPALVPPPDVQVARPPVAVPAAPNPMAAADRPSPPARSAAPAGPPRSLMGPAGSARSSDTERVGTAPNGEPLYAAAWYREPRDGELSGYLSTAQGPGWGLIACRTVADYRVEDCVGLGESPQGSRIERAVLAAAWQFRVRPPRLGGKSQVGTWVRIRIDYGT